MLWMNLWIIIFFNLSKYTNCVCGVYVIPIEKQLSIEMFENWGIKMSLPRQMNTAKNDK